MIGFGNCLNADSSDKGVKDSCKLEPGLLAGERGLGERAGGGGDFITHRGE